MTIPRRALLARTAVGLGVLACGGAVAQPADGAAYLGVETSAATGRSRAAFFAASGLRIGAVPLDFRAHGAARHGDLLAVFPRRPGTRFALVDAATLEVRAVVEAPAGRHYYGHGAFTRDGRTLLTTENDMATLDGGIGVHELTGAAPRRLGTIRLPGPGPHDVVRVPGARDRFRVALGGLRTHPDYGRTPLNLHDFASELVDLDLDRAEVAAMGRWPGAEGVSLRHLACDGRGRLYVGGQRPGGRGGAGAVLWVVEDGSPRALDAAGLLGGYVSSVAARDGVAVATSVETGTALHLVDGIVARVARIDGASAAALGPDAAAVSGFGVLRLGDARVPASAGHEFDNHGLALG